LTFPTTIEPRVHATTSLQPGDRATPRGDLRS